MVNVLVAPAAWRALDELIESRSLPEAARARTKASIATLSVFPERGRRLHGRWSEFRCVLGPWPWMLIVYRVDGVSGAVQVVAIQDARAAAAATSVDL